MGAGLVAYFVELAGERSLLPGDVLEIGDRFAAVRVNAGPHVAAGILEHGVDRVHRSRTGGFARGISRLSVIQPANQTVVRSDCAEEALLLGNTRSGSRLSRLMPN